MFKIKKVYTVNKAYSKSFLAVFILMIVGLANASVSAQNCPLVISSVSGDVSLFTTSVNNTTLSIASTPVSVGKLASVQVVSTINSNVTVMSIPIGTDDPAIIVASKIDPTQSASFVLLVSDTE